LEEKKKKNQQQKNQTISKYLPKPKWYQKAKPNSSNNTEIENRMKICSNTYNRVI